MRTSHYAAPSVLVDWARSTIGNQTPELIGMWPRAAAILARQALEITLDQFWLNAEPGVENASARAQLSCLGKYIDPELANRIRYTWHGLSTACHHHAYELPPTASELNGWLSDIETLVQEVEGLAAPGLEVDDDLAGPPTVGGAEGEVVLAVELDAAVTDLYSTT